jgi:hypothetical protein
MAAAGRAPEVQDDVRAVQDDARAVQAAPSRHSGSRAAVERVRNPAFTMMGEFRRAAWRRIVNAPASDADHREP